MRLLVFLVALSLAATPASYAQTTLAQRSAGARDTVGRYEAEIREFEHADRRHPPKHGGVVFVGSSSIRMWPRLKRDFPGVNVIQRGFGGSQIDEVLHYAPRIVLPYRPALIVLYAGENDLVVGRSPEQIFSSYKEFVTLVHKTLPHTKIAYISIKPSGDRWVMADKMRATNEMIRKHVTTDPRLLYVNVFTPMLGADGTPREELFAEDHLHMNGDGYAIWRELLTPIVAAAAVRTPAASH
jgi:lysophospholipase L1-like esterase